jgi:hypothetical protein
VRQIGAKIQLEKRKKAGFAPDCAQERSQPYCCFEPDSAGILPIRLERLYVGSLPSLGALYDVKLHGLAFLQALETTRVDCRVVHEDILTVLARDEPKAFRVIKPLHSTLFHFVRISCIELRWMNRSEHWQNLAFGRVLLTPGSVLTLTIFYHFRQNSLQELSVSSHQMVLVDGSY